MSPDDLEVVADDLQYLSTWGSDTSDGEIRRGSSVLRRLLVEDVYGQAWRAIGRDKQPILIAVEIAGIAAPQHLSKIEFMLAAGAKFRGIKLACMMFNVGNAPLGALSPPIREDGYPGEREFTLSEYLSSISGVVHGRSFTRREVIKYIANVKGGVHLSQKQKMAEKKLVERLGKIEKRMVVHTTDGLLVELAAISQALGRSDDASEFIQHVTALT